MNADAKATPLKALQGLLWREGYADGTLRGTLYPDVAPALRAWHAEGRRLLVYSSGSVEAQRLIFAHSNDGDLSPLFEGYFGTRTGAKREGASYASIATSAVLAADAMLFLSDGVAEWTQPARPGFSTAKSCGAVTEPLRAATIQSRQTSPPCRARSQIGARCDGRLLCRGVRFRLDGPILGSRLCWCRDCQYLASANASVGVLAAGASLHVTGRMTEHLRTANSGRLVRHRFCPSCGTGLFGDCMDDPALVVIRAGALDDRDLAVPQSVIWASSAPRWACFDPGLPRSDRQVDIGSV